MAAEIVIAQDYGASYASYEAEVAKNVFYLIDEDSGILTKTTNPLRRPSAGTTYSYEVWLRLRVDVAPSSQVYNCKAWYSSGLPAGYTLTVNSDVVDTYVQPVDTESAVGTRVDFTTKNSEINSIDLDGTLVNIGDYSSWLVFQIALSSAAVLGAGAVSWIVQYDEV